MRAAYPFIDEFVAAGTLGSLERLGGLLAERSSPHSRLRGRPRRTGIGGSPGRDSSETWTVRLAPGPARSAPPHDARPPRTPDRPGARPTAAPPLAQGGPERA